MKSATIIKQLEDFIKEFLESPYGEEWDVDGEGTKEAAELISRLKAHLDKLERNARN